ncbi:unnamed protein product [Clavelina lepadiformis]|uniref:G-protein coupled receptors family 1 profile domain-containing protein n=1 Tax=Clavelina lepadiformis TaxID=159417 RepID=A0ABP0FBI9_CLALP
MVEFDSVQLNCSHLWIKEDVEAFRWFGVVVGGICILFGTMGNVITIAAVKREPYMKTAFYTFLLSMCGIDLVAALFTAPFVLTGFVLMEWPIGGAKNFTVDLVGYFYFCSGYSSVVHLVVISIHRFIEICRIKRLQFFFRSPKNVLFVVVLCWTLAPLLLLPLLIGNYFVWNPSIFMCTFSLSPATHLLEYSVAMRVLFQVVPLVVMPPLYITMFHKVHLTSVRLQQYECMKYPLRKKKDEAELCSSTKASSVQLMASENISSQLRNLDSTVKHNALKALREKCHQRRLLIMCACICLSFAVLFLPSAVVHLLRHLHPCIDPRVVIASVNVTWLNPVINPIIYGILNTKIRKGYRKLIADCFSQLKCF